MRPNTSWLKWRRQPSGGIGSSHDSLSSTSTSRPPSLADVALPLLDPPLSRASEDDLQRAGVARVGEHVVRSLELVEREVVGDELRGVDLAAGHEAQQG